MCIEVGSTCPEPCNAPAPYPPCSENQVRCDMGYHNGNCGMGDYCMDKPYTCPPPCFSPPPQSPCPPDQVRCDMGTVDGCWQGDYCITASAGCP